MTIDSAMLVFERVLWMCHVCVSAEAELRGAGAQVDQVGPPPALPPRRAPARLSPPPHAGPATCAPCTTPLSPHSREPCATFLASPERSVSRSLAATRSFLN